MKQFLACGLVCLLVSSESTLTAQQAVPSPVSAAATVATTSVPASNMLLGGTPVKLRLSETMSSADARVGQSVPFEVVEEVDVQGIPVIAKGSTALATVTIAESKRRMGKGGKLDMNIDSVRLVDGEKSQLRAVEGGKGGGHTGAMTGAIVATSLVLWPAAPFFLLMHGKDITIPKGTEITAFVQGDMRLEMSKFAPVGATPSTSAVSTQLASLLVESNIAGCDIEIDGSFVGNTPSTLSLAFGNHTIAVKKPGYIDWTKTLNVAGNNVHLSAALDPLPVAAGAAPVQAMKK